MPENSEPLSHLFDINCYNVSVVEAHLNGGEVHYGWAVGPVGRAQHVWVVRDGVVVDLLGWSDHEDMGTYEIAPSTIRVMLRYLKDNYIMWPSSS